MTEFRRVDWDSAMAAAVAARDEAAAGGVLAAGVAFLEALATAMIGAQVLVELADLSHNRSWFGNDAQRMIGVAFVDDGVRRIQLETKRSAWDELTALFMHEVGHHALDHVGDVARLSERAPELLDSARMRQVVATMRSADDSATRETVQRWEDVYNTREGEASCYAANRSHEFSTRYGELDEWMFGARGPA